MDPQAIASMLERIARSTLSVGDFFKRHKVPFSRTQYFEYRKRFAARGLEGLIDGRSGGNRRTLTREAQAVIRAFHHDDPTLSLRQLAEKLKFDTSIEVAPSTISRFLRAQGLKIQPRLRKPQVQVVQSTCGGCEIVAALALHLGWARHTAQLMVRERERFRGTSTYQEERSRRDRAGRNDLGQFTRAYNLRAAVRSQRFASIEDKRERKNYSRMSLFKSSEKVVLRKCLGVLALPLFTLNGMQRSINNPLRESLELFCGYKYKHATLEKFLRELKYLGLSGQLLQDQVGFWAQHWRTPETALLCYYVDGNTKALWSKKRVKQNKVTMLGRVMGALEQVFVHDGRGRPVYLETYSGKAPVGEHILGLFEKIEAALEGPGPQLAARRVIVMDAASNGVATLRAFAQQEKYHYVTALDDNQWHPKKVIRQGRAKRYYYGNATLRECRLELEDSKEKGYLIEVRAIVIDWDHGKRTVLITSLPEGAVGASAVVKAYFDRWPCEELQFRQMKSFACLNRVAGYGKKRLADEKVRASQRRLEERIGALRGELKVPLQRIAAQEETIATLIEQQRRMRCKAPLRNGRRRFTRAAQLQLDTLSRKLTACQREIQAISAPCNKSLGKLRRYEKEWLRLQGKEHVYRNDVELDQLMGFFRIALVNIVSFFLTECYKGPPMTLVRVLMNILLLPASIHLTDDRRQVILKRDDGNPKLMQQLKIALRRLTQLNLRDLDERKIDFSLSTA